MLDVSLNDRALAAVNGWFGLRKCDNGKAPFHANCQRAMASCSADTSPSIPMARGSPDAISRALTVDIKNCDRSSVETADASEEKPRIAG